MGSWPALELASTIRHDGDGGVADDLDTPVGATRWVRQQGESLGDQVDVARFVVDDGLWNEIIELRRAVRALFAHAVSPAPPSRADAHRLMPVEQALARLNAAAAREAVVPRLDWPKGAPPRTVVFSAEPDAGVRLVAALARATIDFLSGPERERLRACNAPRCVRYFVKSHGRQEWCKPSCGNRARVARHYERHTAATPTDPTG
ncbi:CGNR zinc finger domain-containing protein [Nonomuraea fuscirosea]|jgi:predicted RNA-binding Zn ribbon-like protein|uniref:CGNR zinc finger domain-containing protein n=1 Tax=Nonomuraea fuscirosea TaxID=1291556 RepID=UPI002DD8CB15|nr:CGNR zinc finger domain-containing protein [Nonomuraea fuscirosea]WSA50086.1 CGNR zinc finger domain-containing protein [Nonomuraea fuscirosea]